MRSVEDEAFRFVSFGFGEFSSESLVKAEGKHIEEDSCLLWPLFVIQ
jgi:hypothetical protein